MYKYIRDIWKRPTPELMRDRLIKWRREQATVRIHRPTRLDRARSVGYKAKKGFILVRQRVPIGGKMRCSYLGGRRPKHNRKTLVLDKNYQSVAEERADKKYVNLDVLNSYPVGRDGKQAWYEVILVDPASPSIKSDPSISWISQPGHRGRVHRGKTSAARKSRGLRNKGKGAEKLRPSRRANLVRRKK